jgi:hypothetical protein
MATKPPTASMTLNSFDAESLNVEANMTDGPAAANKTSPLPILNWYRPLVRPVDNAHGPQTTGH